MSRLALLESEKKVNRENFNKAMSLAAVLEESYSRAYSDSPVVLSRCQVPKGCLKHKLFFRSEGALCSITRYGDPFYLHL